MNAPSKRPPLPDSWVERIFDRMQGLYGSLWLDRWRSGEMIEQGGRQFDRGLLLAKATWGQELAGFAEQPERISKALEACRHRSLPPTAPEFIELCRQQHADMPPALPAPKVPPEVAQVRAQELAATARKIASKPFDGVAWAKTPPVTVKGSAWEKAIIELAERGEGVFLKLLREHVESGVIKSERACAVLNADRVAA